MRRRRNKGGAPIASGERRSLLFIIALLLASVQCQLPSSFGQPPQLTAEAMAGATVAVSATATIASTSMDTPGPTATPPATATALPTPTPSPLPTPTVTATPLPHPLYCTEPPDDYRRVTVGQHALNARTLSMLEVAQQIYTGPGDIMRITQGSYRDVVEASFGTHAGGGAVDISIRDPRNESVFLWDEAEAMVRALRYAGFAAWFRDMGDLGPNSPAHIHAIAVGDAELSAAAQEQVTGAGGYLAGMDGLIAPHGPNVDPHGGPVICPWMEQAR